MRNFLAVVSYTLAAMSGICFAGGIAILSAGKGHQYGWSGEYNIGTGLCSGYQKKKTYYRRHFVECFLSFWRISNNCNDNQK